MSEFDAFNVHELREIANNDNDPTRMDQQAEGWRGMAWLFQAQLERLEAAAKALATAWNSPAGNKFLEEVDKVRQTLSTGQEKAQGNHTAWTAISATAKTAKAQVAAIEQRYLTAWGSAKATFEAEKKKDADNINWAWGGLGDLWDAPDAPDQNAVRAPFDAEARRAMANADTVYMTQYRQNLWHPPKYVGPMDATVPRVYSGGDGNSTYPGDAGTTTGARSPLAGGDQPGQIPGHHPPSGVEEIPGGRQPSSQVPGLEGGLAPTLPPGIPPGQLPPLPPGVPAPPVGGPLPPIVPPVLPPGTAPPGGGPARIPPGTKPPLLPKLPEGTPPVTGGGRSLPGGRAPGGTGLPGVPQDVIGGRQMPGGGRGVPGGQTSPAGRGVPGGAEIPAGRQPARGGEVPGRSGGGRGPNEPVPGGRGAGGAAPGGRGGGESPGGRSVPGGRSAGGPGGRGVTRPVESVIGREPGATAGRGGATAPRGGRMDSEGVVRRPGVSEPGAGYGPSGRGGRRGEDRSAGAGGAASEDDLFQVVDDGVPAVTEPAAPYDATDEQGGPHIGGSGRRR